METGRISEAKAALDSYKRKPWKIVSREKQVFFPTPCFAKVKWSPNSDQKCKLQGKKDRQTNRESEHKHQHQTVHATKKQVPYLKIFVFAKSNKELELPMKRQNCVTTMRQIRALAIFGSLILEQCMVRYPWVSEALLPRGARQALPHQGVWKDWAGLPSGSPYNSVHTLSPSIPRHSAHRSSFSGKISVLYCSRLSPKAYLTKSRERNAFYCKQWKFPVFFLMMLVRPKMETLYL